MNTSRRAFLQVCAAATLALQLAPKPRLICFGDSVTAGAGASTPDHAYVARIAAQLGYTLDNRAIGGTVLAEQLTRAILPARIRPPDVALLLTGYNDMRAGTDLARYQAQLAQAVAHLTQDGARLYLGDCLRMTEAGYAAYGPMWAHGSDAAVAAINGAIHLVGASAAYDPANVVADLVHPNDLGHAQIAAAFVAAMRTHVYVPLIRSKQ